MKILEQSTKALLWFDNVFLYHGGGLCFFVAQTVVENLTWSDMI